MSSTLAWGLALGLLLGTGLWLSFVRLPAMRRVKFVDRVSGQLRTGRRPPGAQPGQLASESPLGPLVKIMWPVLKDLVSVLNRFNPAGGGLQRRLQRAGLEMTITEFRVSQLTYAGGGLLIGSLVIAASVAQGTFNGFLSIVILAVSATSGFILREWYLNEQGTKRSRRILGQFPSIAELIALAVGAGESTMGAIERVCKTSQGDLPDEFSALLADVRSGTPMTAALHRLARRLDLNAMTRFVDAITVASERGTPLAEVMRAQAQDVRDAAKRELMETAGRKEISMMIPVVFGVLPLTIVFAVYPGLSLIDMNL
ncbi:type II secretion system F family protein [Arthrobacter sp. JSM 101049]|uniref:type II secretion system F family protein n=1 Tax=Arthrobacter sp. JSM 101049 TaxID=929097 RepID=UPI0035657159